MSDIVIYALIDPRNKDIRYVGKSSNLSDRVTEHLRREGGNPHRYRWLRQLQEMGREVETFVLEWSNEHDWPEAERWWIKILGECGEPLTNLTEGGDSPPGTKGFRHSEATKRRMSEVQTGHPVSEETKAKISQANKGQVPWIKGLETSPEAKRKISEIRKAQWASGVYDGEEYRRRLSRGKKAAWERGAYANRRPRGTHR